MANIMRAAMTETKNVAALPENIDRMNVRGVERIRRTNVNHNIGLIRDAFKHGVRIICLNELFPAPYFAIGKEAKTQWTRFSESAEDGASVEAIRELTRELAITVLAPIYEQTDHGDRYNTVLVIARGEVLGKYRKTHIPHGSNEQGNFTEGFYYNASDDANQNAGCDKVGGHPLFPVFATAAGKVGIATCFDRHFQYAWQHLENGGAEIVFSPAVTFGDTSEAVWEHEFPAEAVRHGFFVGGSNRKGREFPNGPEFFGKSYFVGPDGKKLPNLSGNDELVIAELDLDQAHGNSSGWNLPANQRIDLARSALRS